MYATPCVSRYAADSVTHSNSIAGQCRNFEVSTNSGERTRPEASTKRVSSDIWTQVAAGSAGSWWIQAGGEIRLLPPLNATPRSGATILAVHRNVGVSDQ